MSAGRMPGGRPDPTGIVRLEDIAAHLDAWTRHRFGHAARPKDVRPMPGNAGLSFGFTVDTPGAEMSFVIRLAPPGVRRRGNTDVLRQVPLLRALADAGIPVAPVVWSTGDPAWFGTDALIQEWVPGRPLHMFDAASGCATTEPLILVRRAVDVLAGIHRVHWRDTLPEWETPREVAEEIDFWLPLMRRAAEGETLAAAVALATRLKATPPAAVRMGLMHGDYQTHNILYDADGAILAVVDWELAGIGAQLIDLGWLSMMTDPAAWAPEHAGRMRVIASPSWLCRRYEEASGAPVDGFEWYRAVACYRFAVIAAFNLRLHRTGRRVDPWYESLASSIPALLEHGGRLVA